ncbi:MAG: FkbM family methyltransferase [Acidobacteriota bacterium]|nr:FkbM family methyltransferase [Acidobacteriota bacterium]
MSVTATIRHYARALGMAPEILRNCMRYRVVFLMSRWFKTPAQIRIAGKQITLSEPARDETEADFIECFLRNCYGLGRQLGTLRTVVDVGAHAGFFALAVSSHYPEAIVDCYEPNPRILPFLQANVVHSKMRIFAEAIGSEEGWVSLIDDGQTDQARVEHESGADVAQITMQTVLERAGGAIDLLKLNCEGAEWDILKPGIPWERVRHLRFEYHLYHRGSVEEMQQMLAQIGFKILRLQRRHAQAGIIWALQERSAR